MTRKLFLRGSILITLAGSCMVPRARSEESLRDRFGFLTESAVMARTRAAYLFADRLVGVNGSRFLEAFMRSYNSAVDLEWAGSKDERARARVGSFNLSSPLLESDRFRDELKKIVVESGRTPEQLAAPDIGECVAIMNGNKVCCSGTFVSQTAILTAAHCLDSCGDKARLEQNGATTTATIDRQLDKTFPGFDPSTLVGDIAIMRLKQGGSAQLATLADDSSMSRIGPVLAVGFGSTGSGCQDPPGVRRKAKLPVAAGICDQTAIQKFGCQSGEFVAGSNTRGVCPADSGGAAFVELSGGRVLAGVIVQQIPSQDYTGRFVRMDKDVRDWIANNL